MSLQPFVHPGPAKSSSLDEIKSFVGAIKKLVKVEAERDEANVQLDKVRQLCTEADAEGQDVPVSVLRDALEPTP